MNNTSIVASGQKQEIGCRVVLWDETNGLNLYKNINGKLIYMARNIELNELRSHINCFVLHHSATIKAIDTYHGLIGRGLSVNFIIDDDINDDGCATIYQCLDIKDAGYSHKPLNQFGPGVEISYQPIVKDFPTLYNEEGQAKHKTQPHEQIEDTIHGAHLKVYGPSEAQTKTVIKLLEGFSKLFPHVKMNFPRDKEDNISKTVAPIKEGVLAHFHITREKIDPCGFPFEKVQKELDQLIYEI